jgi:hypothetical protein
MLPLIGLCDFAQTSGDANSSIAHEQVTPLCAGEYLSILASMASRTLSDSRAQDHGEQVDFSHMVDAASRYISSLRSRPRMEARSAKHPAQTMQAPS